MMILWIFDPSDEKNVWFSFLNLKNLIFMRNTLKQSYHMLFELFRSFRHAIKYLINNVQILQFLDKAICDDEYTSVNEESLI